MTFTLKPHLQLPHANENEKLNRIIRGNLRRKKRTSVLDSLPTSHTPWPASLFLLNTSRLYKKLSSSEKQNILEACNRFILSESYFIEKAGLAYCAKMILLSETTECRQMYALIASDEAVHLEWLSPYVEQKLRNLPQGNFIFLLSKLIEECDQNTLFFLVQTVLEGWGVAYYKMLGSTCQLPGLQKILLTILRDEVLHHKAGNALFDPRKINNHSQKIILEGMRSYTEALKTSTQNIVRCFEETLGELTFSDLINLFGDLKNRLSTKIKLKILKNIMQQPATHSFISYLEAQRYFKPYSDKECASIYRQNKT